MFNSKIEFVLNNKLISINNLDTNTTVLNFLRNEKNLTGTKEGCASGAVSYTHLTLPTIVLV